MTPRCIVIFPMYRQPDKTELAFLENGKEILSQFDMVIAGPESLDTSAGFGSLVNTPVVRFDDEYFKDIAGYNRLLLSKEFYRAFAQYDYILIHQADVYIFKDELNYWCSKGYAYIGAPWYRPEGNMLGNFVTKIKRSLSSSYGKKHNKTGNGGLSLRNVKAALKVLEACPQPLLEKYNHASHHLFNEDVFFSLEASLIDPNFTIPGLDEALRFAIEFNPASAFEKNGRKLPFGCHAPLVHDREFWSLHIPELNA